MLLSFNHANYQITPTQTVNPCFNHHIRRFSTFSLPSKPYRKFPLPRLSSSYSTGTRLSNTPAEARANGLDFLRDNETENANSDGSFELAKLMRFESPKVEVKELEELPEQWRRSKLAWLCKELPAHRSGTFIRVLNAQRKWIRQDDCTYVVVHCMRIRENESAFRVKFSVLFSLNGYWCVWLMMGDFPSFELFSETNVYHSVLIAMK